MAKQEMAKADIGNRPITFPWSVREVGRGQCAAPDLITPSLMGANFEKIFLQKPALMT